MAFPSPTGRQGRVHRAAPRPRTAAFLSRPARSWNGRTLIAQPRTPVDRHNYRRAVRRAYGFLSVRAGRAGGTRSMVAVKLTSTSAGKSGSPSVLSMQGAGVYIASMGAQHIRNGALHIKQEKAGVELIIPMPSYPCCRHCGCAARNQASRWEPPCQTITESAELMSSRLTMSGSRAISTGCRVWQGCFRDACASVIWAI
jgi:hypothetical protein